MLFVCSSSHPKQPRLGSARPEGNAGRLAGWQAGRPVNTKRHGPNRQSDSPQNRNASSETWTAADPPWQAWASLALPPHTPNRAPWPRTQGQPSPFDCQAWPPSPPQSQNRWVRVRIERVDSTERRRRSRGEPRESLSTCSGDTCMLAHAGVWCCGARSGSKRQPPPQTGQFDQPCGKTVPSENPGGGPNGAGTALPEPRLRSWSPSKQLGSVLREFPTRDPIAGVTLGSPGQLFRNFIC